MKRDEAYSNFVKVQQTYTELKTLKKGITGEIQTLLEARSKAEGVITWLNEHRENNPSSIEIQSSEFMGDNARFGEDLWSMVVNQIGITKNSFNNIIDEIDMAIERKNFMLTSAILTLNQSKEELSRARQQLESATD